MTRFSFSSNLLKVLRLLFPAIVWLLLISPVFADRIYTIEDGDSAWSIAIKFGVSLEDLYAANGWASDENPVLQIGDAIAVPSSRTAADEQHDESDDPDGISDETTYIVESGDIFSDIARRFGVSTLALCLYNGLSVDDIIRPGQMLSIPPSDYDPHEVESEEVNSNDPTAPEPAIYLVQPGDSPWGIARQFGINLQTLLAYNNLPQDAVLQVGDELLIPVEAGQMTTSRSNSLRRHTVVEGDTLVYIASSYGTTAEAIAHANNITLNTLLRTGQELIIPVYRTVPSEAPGNEEETTDTQVREDLNGELTPLPDINGLGASDNGLSSIAGWHSEIFDFSRIEEPEPSSADPAPVTTGGLSIDGYFSDGTPYHLYTIRRGDTLGDVAGEFDVTQSEIREYNGLDTRSTLRIGRDLKIPMPVPVAVQPDGSVPGSDIQWGAPAVEIGNGEGTATGRAVVEEAMKYLGTRYVYGGNSLTGGIDCSGFTSQIYAMFGISLYRSARDQATNGIEISYGDMEPGDIVCFHTTRPGISHVGIYIGNGEFIHSSSARDGVVISPLDEGYYNERFVCARRVLD